ncbi:hypothetical protein [Andreprevotia chitinilytica]|uniref:hypothetical protein n=1 Tax=Andreprevotia chitinilytica TaxID=396808 RepID=UPI0012EB943A|nr:hypothetical protein [Andreprevotia chitinilytica]
MTPRAVAAIEWLFEQSIQDNIHAGSGENSRFDKRKITQAEQGERKLVVLNISSYLFRIVALFDFDSSPSTVQYLQRHSRSQDLQGQLLLDAYAELVNMICGKVNRALCEAFRHAGMSTPFFLESSCAAYVDLLEPTHAQTYEVAIGDDVRFNLIVCICSSDDGQVDFDVDRTAQPEEIGGELELF